MKRSLLFSTLFSILFVLPAQSQGNDIILTPGVGIGKVKLGMTEAQAKAVLGKDMISQNLRQVMKDFKNFNEELAIDSTSQFIIGFDKCLTVSESMQEKIPIFKLYFNKNKLVFIAVTSYGNTEDVAENHVRVGKNLRFKMTQEECEESMGTDYIKLPYNEYVDCMYYNKGLELMYDEGILRFVGIYKPDPNFPNRIKTNSPKLRAIWDEL